MTSSLDSNGLDRTVTGLKSLLNVIPGVGGGLAEILGHVIPGQRLDRVCRFLAELDARLAELEARPGIATDPQFVDLFEDATLQSLRALSPQRTTYLVNFIAQAAGADDPNFDVDRRLLQILSELSDAEIEILRAHQGLEWTRLQRRYYWEPMGQGPYEALSAEARNVYDARRVAWDMHVNSLRRLGLLDARVRAVGPTRHDFEIDENTGLPQVDSFHISVLGRLLLRRIGNGS